MSGVAARPVALTGSDQLVRSGPATFRGFTIRETAGATAAVRIHDGTTAAGTLLGAISLPANGSAAAWYGDGGLRAETGIFVDILSGAVEGSVFIG